MYHPSVTARHNLALSPIGSVARQKTVSFPESLSFS
jgi:hypothetical protein